MALSWKKTFNIGIHEIDSQHRELFFQLDKFEDSLSTGKGSDVLIDMFSFLGNYARRHFRAEEELQQLYGYPHLEMHAAEHKKFVERLAGLEARLLTEGPSEQLASHTNSFLTQWLISHVTTLDKELQGYINEARTRVWEKWLVDHF
jgi:hemerythrin